MKLHLRINDGTLAGRQFELESGFLTIGRGENCSIRFDPMTERIASKQHSFIEAKVDGYYLTDNQSTNGTWLNGGRIAAPTKLASGDTIQFGMNGVTASVRIEQPGIGADALPAPRSREAFRDFQVQQFNELAAKEPQNPQNSISNLGLGSMRMQLETDPEKGPARNYIGATLAIIAVVFLSLVVMLIVTTSLSPTENGKLTINSDGVLFAVMASIVAFVPAVFYILPFIWLDRYDPEPPWLLALAFAWGALVAVIVSFFINSGVGQVVFELTNSSSCARLIGAVVSAPIFEEGSKGIGLLLLLIFFRRYFDDILDGIVFAGVIALGFATVENVLYYGRAIGSEGAYGLMILFAVRGILSPFAHATFTSMTGIGCGIARESHRSFVRFAMPIVGYICAVALHAIWNGMSFVSLKLLYELGIDGACEACGLGGENIGLCAFLAAYIVIAVPFFFFFVGFALYIMRRQNRILTEMLAIDIARGLIPKEHATIATSASKSSRWVLGGIFNGKFKARSNYVRAIGKLGLSYWHIQRATAAQGHTGSFQQNPILRDEVLKWRDQV